MNYVYYRDYEVGGRRYNIVCVDATQEDFLPSECHVPEDPIKLQPDSPHLENGQFPGYLTVNAGWIGVRSVDGTQAPESFGPDDIRFHHHWYRIVFLRTLVTGTYATEFYATVTPHGARPDFRERLIFAKTHKVIAVPKQLLEKCSFKESDWSVAAGERGRVFATGPDDDTKTPWLSRKATADAEDGAQFVKRAEMAMTSIINSHAGDQPPPGGPFIWQAPPTAR